VTGEVSAVVESLKRPNGLAFSPDESLLYIAETGVWPRLIHAFDVVDGGRSLSNGRLFARCAEGERPDGFRVDVDGNLWCGWGMSAEFDGVRVFDASARPIGHMHLPERCANLCFGGRHRNRLSSRSLYAVYVNTQGAV
jgi:gluconolactonase